MTAKEFITKTYPTMVDNWSNQAALLSYVQVAQLMDDFHEEFLRFPDDFHEGKRPTDE